MLLRKFFSSSFIFIFLVGTLYFIWQRVDLPCEKPLQYTLGTFDTRFGISEADFLQEVATAERVWEEAAQKELFTYIPEAPFKVHLVFDERQKRTLDAQKLEAAREQTEGLQQNLTKQQNTKLAQYQTESKEYEKMLATFKKRLNAYNQEIEKWNKQGGAPEEEYEELQKMAKALEKNQEELEKKRQGVNRLAVEVNAFSKQQVNVVGKYNDQVEQYVGRYGSGAKEFDQGEYIGTEINIYQYDDLPHLRAVLVHEFGHALGLTHGNDPASVMYHLMDKQEIEPVTLSSEDKAMLAAQCNQTVWDIILQRIDLLKESRV